MVPGPRVRGDPFRAGEKPPSNPAADGRPPACDFQEGELGFGRCPAPEGFAVAQENGASPRAVERRASRRIAMNALVKVESRKGSLGLGANLVKYPSDLSETGVRLVLKAALNPGQEVEVLLTGGFGGPVKRLATAVWCVPAEGGYLVGLHLQGPIPYADLQRLAPPARPPLSRRTPGKHASLIGRGPPSECGSSPRERVQARSESGQQKCDPES